MFLIDEELDDELFGITYSVTLNANDGNIETKEIRLGVYSTASGACDAIITAHRLASKALYNGLLKED